MTIQLTGEEIELLLHESKILPEDFASRVKLKTKRGHKEYDIMIEGSDGHAFLLKFRQNERNALDFSVILLYTPEESNQPFRLRRYNGKSHEHTNKSKGIRSLVFISIQQQNDTSKWDLMKMRTLNSQIGMQIFRVPQNA